jgi:hypothetical protein
LALHLVFSADALVAEANPPTLLAIIQHGGRQRRQQGRDKLDATHI